MIQCPAGNGGAQFGPLCALPIVLLGRSRANLRLHPRLRHMMGACPVMAMVTVVMVAAAASTVFSHFGALAFHFLFRRPRHRSRSVGGRGGCRWGCWRSHSRGRLSGCLSDNRPGQTERRNKYGGKKHAFHGISLPIVVLRTPFGLAE